jgi:NAD(P)-dependent dehydrogenase (short-subunit alcohol dehydrogenase family)
MKQALITGGAGGLGRITAGYLASKGWHVFAADVNTANQGLHKHPGITPVHADIASENSVNEAFNFVSGKTDGLDAIIHLAGILVLGSLVEIPSQDIERIMNVNLLGIYRINRTFLPLLLQRKGRIITVTSETGWQRAAPFNGAYAMSKHALEAYSDALRRELSLLGIRVIKVQPGAMKTGLTGKVEDMFSDARQSSRLFKEHLEAAVNLSKDVFKKAADPERLARIIHKTVTVKHPKIRYSVMPDRARSVLEWLPVTWADWIYRRILKAGKPQLFVKN